MTAELEVPEVLGCGALPAGCATVIEFDFDQKRDSPISLDDVPVALERGHFVWIDVKGAPRSALQRLLIGVAQLEESALEPLLEEEVVTQHARFERALHLSMCAFPRRGTFELTRVDLMLCEQLLVTSREGPVQFLDALRKNYRLDFVSFAKTPSFLLYEIWEHLLDSYLAAQKSLEERVEQVQEELRSPRVDDEVFRKVSDLSADLLRFRKVLLPARTALSDLSTRHSLVVSDVTQRYLANLAAPLDHILSDLLVDAELLSESLNLYMSLVAHRTNDVMKRLTAVSVIFMPLTFLVGVYGMNFEVFPELRWHYGYAYFWAFAAVMVAVLLLMMRRGRLI
ncbi:MAG: magnesium transporter CorA family protein [Polyangiaceae bacterium]